MTLQSAADPVTSGDPQVRCWVTHLVVSQPTDDDRRDVLCCLLRAAETCWNLANFHGAAQLVAGLR